MNWFINAKMSTKLILSFGLFMILLIFVILNALSSLNKISTMSENLYKKQLNLVDNVTNLDDENNAMRSALANLLLSPDPTGLEAAIKKISDIYENQEKAKTQILEIIQNDGGFLQDFDNFINLRIEAKNIRDNQIIPAIRSGNIEQAKKYLLTEYHSKDEGMSQLTDKMTEKAKVKANQEVENARKQVASAEYYFSGVGVLSVILCIILISILNRLIAFPMNELSSIAKKIANRDLILSEFSFFNRHDEVGILGTSFKRMAENLNELTLELSEAINQLNSSSNEIVTASNQLAASAAETATSINETTATIEEVKQTSEVASKKAKFVSDASSKTNEMSDNGKKSITEMGAVISKIRAQMSVVADTMTRLSEQTQTVETIIATVEDLSQQTNLLAVNASIEASKAGEHGKGFSVVAQEVKSLASQSKQATSQIRNILSDIQKATSAAVMAVELSGKAVDTGVSKTDEAGETILRLIQTVSDNAQAASQIATVNHQQLIGMDQARIAMDNIRQAGEQNLESAKLLKDSMLSVQSLSARLKNMVGQFKFKK